MYMEGGNTNMTNKKRISRRDLGITSTPWKKEDKPEYGMVYRLTSGSGEKSIMNGNTWEESKVKE